MLFSPRQGSDTTSICLNCSGLYLTQSLMFSQLSVESVLIKYATQICCKEVVNLKTCVVCFFQAALSRSSLQMFVIPTCAFKLY